MRSTTGAYVSVSDKVNSMSLALRLAEKFTSFHGVIDEIREQLHSYRQVAEISPLPTALISREGHNVYTNEAYQFMLECDADELLDQGWEQFVHPEDLETIRTAWFAFVNDHERDRFSHEMRFVTKHSRQVITVTAAAARIPNDGFVAFVSPCGACPQMERWLPRLGMIQQPSG